MIFVALILLFLLIPAALAGIWAAPFVPIWGSDVNRVLKLMPRKQGLKFCELGFGSGRMMAAVFKARPDFDVTGIEIQPILFLITWIRFKVKGLKINLLFGNFFKSDLIKQDVIYLYWTEKTTHKVLDLKLKKGTIVISYAFSITGWKPIKVDNEKGKLPIFVYKFTAGKRAGNGDRM